MTVGAGRHKNCLHTCVRSTYVHTHIHTRTHTCNYVCIYVLCNYVCVCVCVRGSIQNIPDWRCKNHKTHHKAYRPPSPSKQFPPACRHRSHRLLHFWNASWKYFSVRVLSTLGSSAWIYSILSNRRPFSFSFIFGNRHKSQGTKLEEYGGWGMTVI
jgi:hypothetical protein